MSVDFSSFVVSKCIARVCLALGYQEATPECIEILIDITQQYLSSLGQKTLEHAESSGRPHAGVHDILSVLGSSSFSRISWHDLRDFGFSNVKLSQQKWQQPFPQEISTFPLKRKISKSQTTVRGNNKHKHFWIPKHLPCFPSRHSFLKVSRNKHVLKQNFKKSQFDQYNAIQQVLVKLENNLE
jgi:hypothetical protein